MATIEINKRGRLTLPKGLRQSLGLQDGGSVMAEEMDGGILLRPAVSYPIEIYTEARIRAFDDADKALRQSRTVRKRR